MLRKEQPLKAATQDSSDDEGARDQPEEQKVGEIVLDISGPTKVEMNKILQNGTAYEITFEDYKGRAAKGMNFVFRGVWRNGVLECTEKYWREKWDALNRTLMFPGCLVLSEPGDPQDLSYDHRIENYNFDTFQPVSIKVIRIGDKDE